MQKENPFFVKLHVWDTWKSLHLLGHFSVLG